MINYTTDELNGLAPEDLTILRAPEDMPPYSWTAASLLPNAQINSGEGFVSVTNINEFSSWTLAEAPVGTITVKVEAQTKSSRDFFFRSNLPGFGNDLDLDDAVPDDGDDLPNMVTDSDIPPADYFVSLFNENNAFQVSAIRVEGDTDDGSLVDVNLRSARVDIDLDQDENITVTFVINTNQFGDLLYTNFSGGTIHSATFEGLGPVTQIDNLNEPRKLVLDEGNKVYWTGRNIQRADRDDSNNRSLEDLIDADNFLSFGIDLDLINEKIYTNVVATQKLIDDFSLSDVTANDDIIIRSDLDSNNVELVASLEVLNPLSFRPRALELDQINQKIYLANEDEFGNNRGIYVMDWNPGTGLATNLNPLYDGSALTDFNPVDMTIDVTNGKIYILDRVGSGGNTGRILVGNLDGSGALTAIPNVVSPDDFSGISLDPGNNLIYYISGGAIRKIGLDGSNEGLVVNAPGATDVTNIVEPLVNFNIPSQPGTLVVTNTNDNGTGSLRQAIRDANGNPNGNTPDVIQFNIPGNGPHRIQPLSALPNLTEAVVIDGGAQPGADCSVWPPTLMIELNGELVSGDEANGLTLISSAQGSSIKGLVINGFSNHAIEAINANNNTFQCNFIGTNVAGTDIIPNEREGIRLTNSANGNLIGGTQANQRNLISANKSGQIDINESSANNIVQGNYVGTDVTGTIGLSYHVSSFTIEVDDDSHDALIGGTAPGAGNLVSGNGNDGIQIDDNAYNVTVQGNLVGTDYTGTKALPNLGDGIEVDDDAFNVLIGGTTPAARNIISGNDEEAFQIDDRARNVFIYGNYIGTDITGVFAIPNGRDTSDTNDPNPLNAFEIDDGADSIFVGGLEPGQGNIISGNFSGGFEINSNADNVFVRGNKIGLNVNGDPLGNGNHGIYVGGDALNVVIEQNEIAFNGGAGILLGEESESTPIVPTGVRISRNSIYNNAELGIDITLGGLLSEARFLPGDGITANDPQDTDEGPNGLQNSPVLTSAETVRVSSSFIKGSLNSTPNTTFRIEYLCQYCL